MAILRPRHRKSTTAAVSALSLRRLLLPLAAALLLHLAHGRPMSPSDLVSDGGLATGAGLGFPGFLRMGSAEGACENTYGFMPCTQTALGNLFLLVVYGYLMFTAAKYLSDGSEMLLQILGPGIVGGLFLPVLGALPDAILILVSGLSGTKEVAQQKVLIGMGLLAGSTVMILTLLWGSCVVVGKADLPGRPTESENSNRFLDSGISTDVQTSYAARIMIISIIPFIIIQSPKIFKFSSGGHWIVLVTLIVAVALLISYCLYQVYQPWIQKRRLAYAKLKHVMSGFLRHVHKESLGRLLNSDGSPNEDVIRKLFKRIDLDNNSLISRPELRALIIGIQFDKIDLDSDEAVDRMMNDFDTSHDDNIDVDEFVGGIKKHLYMAKSSVPNTGPYSKKFLDDFHNKTGEEHNTLLDTSDENVENIDNPTLETLKALLCLLVGTVIALAFADPLVDAVNNFSSATKIPSFFISFIAMPLATNSSEAVSALIFASRKKLRTSSLAFSEIYGAVTMNNTLCLAVFLALVYVRQLTWDFSAEVLIILIVCVVMGLFASFKTTFPLWTCFIAYLLYPFSLVLVYVLDYIYGWS